MGGAPEEGAAQDRQAGSTPETHQSHPAGQRVVGLLGPSCEQRPQPAA